MGNFTKQASMPCAAVIIPHLSSAPYKVGVTAVQTLPYA